MAILSQHKPKHLLAIGFTVIYLLTLLFNISSITNFESLLPFLVAYIPMLICPVLVLVYLLCSKQEVRTPDWLLMIAFGITAIRSVCSLLQSTGSILPYLDNPLLCLNFIGSCIQTVAVVCIFAATIRAFRCRWLMKYGAITYALVYIFILLVEFFAHLLTGYFENVPSEYSSVNFGVLIQAVAHILFYFGIFLSSESTSSSDA